MTSLMLDAALLYAALGLPVFPLWPMFADGRCACDGRFGECVMRGKHPATRWRHGGVDELPTRDPDRIRRWWGPGHDGNGIPLHLFGIGIPTGLATGLFVLDVDAKPEANGIESLRRLEAEHGALPEGPLAATPGDGWHHVFRAPPGGGKSSASVIAPGLDTRGEGGMVAVAPTLHKSGRRYRWERRLSLYLPDRMPEVPQWVLDLSEPRRTTSAPSTQPSAWHVDFDDAAATTIELLDGAYVAWMVDYPEEVSREAWRTLATNLHAACAGHADLLAHAQAAWHAISAADGVRYRHGDAARVWRNAAESPPISFEHSRQHGAPDEVCPEGEKNLVLLARALVRANRRSPSSVTAALTYLAQNPGTLSSTAIERRISTRDLLIEEGFLEDTTGYVVSVPTDRKGGPASPA